MKVILLEDVKSLGKKGDIVNINDGYARNYVLPRKLGMEANNKNMNDLKLRKANAEKIAREQLEQAQDFAKAMEEDEVVLSIKAGEGEGHLVPFPQRRLRRVICSNAGKKLTRKNCAP